MKKLVLATATLVLVSASAANADFKIAEFTLGEENSFKSTVSQSLNQYASRTDTYQPTNGAAVIKNDEFGELFNNLKKD